MSAKGFPIHRVEVYETPNNVAKHTNNKGKKLI